MRWPQPSPLALHLAMGAPLIALGVWFGAIDMLPFGEDRCAGCGVEGYVIAAHVAAAAWLGAVVAAAATVRRRVREGVAAPGRVTLGALTAVAVFVAASVAWHPLSTLPALAAMVVSVVLLPVAAIWWLLAALVLARDRAAGRSGAAASQLLAAWVSLAVLLPAIFGWVWAGRVAWFVF